VLEQAETPEERMASPLLHGRPVDLGAAYFTVRDPGFAEVVGRWRSLGLARPWTAELAVLTGGGRGRAPGPMRWATPAGLQTVVGELAEGIAVELERTVERVGPGPVVDGEPADAVVLAMPDPQARRLVPADSPAAAELADRRWRPVVTVAAGWQRRVWEPLPAAFVNDHPVLTLVADDGDRRGDGAAVLVAHTTEAFAAEPAEALAPAVAAMCELLHIPQRPVWTHAHHWPFASPAADRDRLYFLGADGIGLAGDGWGSARIETAWRSGTELGRAVVAWLRAA
jgi:predicted NAD/FAD-dependent oxidoreductase